MSLPLLDPCLQTQVERSLQRQQRAASGASYDTASSVTVVATSGISFDLTLLEVENDRLREKAEALLRRQQVLEELAAMHKLVTIDGGRLVWNASATSKLQGAAQSDSPKPAVNTQIDRLEKAVQEIRR